MSLSGTAYLPWLGSMGRYKKSESGARMSSEDYLLHIDRKLGLPVGTVYGLCREAASGKPIERDECKVTYKGIALKSIKAGAHRFIPVPKKVFMIEGSNTDRGRKVLAQVFLSMPDS